MKTKNIIFGVIVMAVILTLGYQLNHQSKNDVKPANEKTESGKKILYYRNSMGNDVSPVPKKDSMGMDYAPVYEEEGPTSINQVRINIDKVQQIGVIAEKATKKDLIKTIRTVGILKANERNEHIIAPRFAGWVDTLYVNTTGEVVNKNEPLLSVYSPELITAQTDFLFAQQGQSINQTLVDPALQRLRYWEIPEEQIRRLKQENKVQTFTLNSPIDGIVIERNVKQGMYFNAGETLYMITDLSNMWVIAEIYEQNLSLVHNGQAVDVFVNAYPKEIFNGTVDYVYPTVDPATRTTQLRIVLPNKDDKLKPDMYGNVELKSALSKEPVLVVPNSALIEGGVQNFVLIQLSEGLFEPKIVELGLRGDDHTQILSGINEGDEVVTRANFLIDSESNLKAALANFTIGNTKEGAPGMQMPGMAPQGAH